MFVGFLMVGLAIPTVLVLVLANTALAKKPNPIVHRVIAGGPDACLFLVGSEQPGCDGNWSLEAIEYADGTVTGQYIDRFAKGGGMHAVIDCLVVDGNQAWVSGTVTQLRFGAFNLLDQSAFVFVASVQDNGTSVNDPVDKISHTVVDDVNDFFFGGPFVGPCDDLDDPDDLLELIDSPDGEVIVE
jgi:hypothetical protein